LAFADSRGKAFHHAAGDGHSSGPARSAAKPKPPLSIASTLPSPLLFPRELPFLAQAYLEEHQEHNSAQTESDQRDGEHFAGQPTDQGGADRTSDNQRRGRSKRQDARTGRHHAKVSLRLDAEQIAVARSRGRIAPSRGQRRRTARRGSKAGQRPLRASRTLFRVGDARTPFAPPGRWLARDHGGA
jgi:hypothetical protein